jgi:dihydrofolate reductase
VGAPSGAAYQTFAASWPSRTGDDFADRMNSLPKYVASSTLDEHLAWNNSQVIRGDVVAEVTKLKQQPGRDILLYGSGQLFNTLLDHHLIDEFRLWVFPLVLGSGKRLFHDGNQPGSFQLVDAAQGPGRPFCAASIIFVASRERASVGDSRTR